MLPMNEKTMASARAKLEIINSIAGPDPDMALAVLSYVLMHVAHENKVMFASIVHNLAMLEIIHQRENGHAE